jgi:hypothetical protein
MPILMGCLFYYIIGVTPDPGTLPSIFGGLGRRFWRCLHPDVMGGSE